MTIDLAKVMQEANQTGAVRLPVGEETYYLIRPKLQVSGGPSPYADSQALLSPPLTRLAYSDRSAWLMATLSQLVYLKFESSAEDMDQLVSSLAQAGILLLRPFNCPDTDTQAFLAHRPGEFRVLAFRGTEDKQDAITDLRAMFRKTPYGRTHEGFVSAYESVQADIEKALAATQEAGKGEQLIICGHSLGGALATVATRMLEAKGVEISACYTFGSPRVGDEEFADSFKTPVYRVVNRSDPVPMVPASGALRYIVMALTRIPVLTWLAAPLVKFMDSGFVGYQHVGDLRLLTGDDGSAKLKTGTAAALTRAKCMVLDNLANPRAWIGLPKIADDHRMTHYVPKLRKIAEDRNQA